MQLIILAVVFVGTVSLVVGVYVYVNRRQLAASDAARTRLRAELEPRYTARVLLRDDSVSSLAFLDRLLSGRVWIEALSAELQRAGSDLRAGTFVLVVAVCALAPAAVGVRAGAAPGLILGAVGAAMPIFWLKMRQKKRLELVETQLPEAMEMMVSAMKAGYSFQAAMKFIGEEMSAPIGPEFARFYEEQRLGIEVREALVTMQERIGSLDVKMFVTAVLIQRETGGNLGEVLSNISDLMRQRVAIRGHIKTLTSEPKNSARVLAALPVLVAAGLMVIDPEFLRPLVDRRVGHFMILYAVVSVALGYMVMMKIADVDF